LARMGGGTPAETTNGGKGQKRGHQSGSTALEEGLPSKPLKKKGGKGMGKKRGRLVRKKSKAVKTKKSYRDTNQDALPPRVVARRTPWGG